MSVNTGTKYYPLYLHLRQGDQDEVTLSFAAIEEILGAQLPASARAHRSWWSNRSRPPFAQSGAWMEAGYHVVDVDLAARQVTFSRPERSYVVPRRDPIPAWDGELVKALRQHMGLSQAELAQRLGVRQQTISEWETGVYEPRRAMSNLLTMVAEQAGYEYAGND